MIYTQKRYCYGLCLQEQQQICHVDTTGVYRHLGLLRLMLRD